MMLRKSVSLFAAILAVCAVASPQAQGTVVIGDFVGTNNTNQTDGWTAQNGATINNNNFAAATTLNTGAMFVLSPTNFQWAIRLDNGARPTLGADILANPILKADVSWTASQWTDNTPADTTDNWAQWNKVAINSNLGWQERAISADTA